MGYVIFLVVATIVGGGIPGFLIGVGLIAFWVWTAGMGSSTSNQPANDSEAHQPQSELSLIRRLESCIDILCSFALKYETQWTSPKVQFVKNSFIHLCDTPEDHAYLRDRLKYEYRPSLATSIHLWLNEHRPMLHELEVIYAKVCLLLVNTCPNLEQIKKDCFSFGTSIGLAYDYCDHELSQMLKEREEYFHEQHTEGEHTREECSAYSELENAAEILGISPNSTRDEIQRAYRNKIKDFHPDRNVNVTDAVKMMLEQQAHLINDARDTMLKHLS